MLIKNFISGKERKLRAYIAKCDDIDIFYLEHLKTLPDEVVFDYGAFEYFRNIINILSLTGSVDYKDSNADGWKIHKDLTPAIEQVCSHYGIEYQYSAWMER